MDKECCTYGGEKFGGKPDGKRCIEKDLCVDDRVILKCNLFRLEWRRVD
jgi:hypothetical protein